MARNRGTIGLNTKEASGGMQRAGHESSFTYDKDFVKKRTVADMTDLMCQESTAHGIGHTWNNRRNLLGVFWFLVTVSLSALLLYVAITLCLDFMSREVQSQTAVKLKGDHGLQLPSVVLCNRAFFSRRKLEAMGISSSLTHYLVASVGSTFVLRETQSGSDRAMFWEEGHAELQRIMADRNMTFADLIQAVSYTCQEIILQCIIGARRLNTAECCSGFTSARTMTGVCHVYLASAADAQPAEGEHMGLSFYINITRDDWPDLDPRILDVSHTAKVGLQATLTSNHTHPGHVVLGKGAVLQPGILTSATVTLTVVRDIGIKTMLDLSESQCLPLAGMQPLPELQNFLDTEPNCDLRATRSCLRRFCNCTLYSLSIPGDKVPLCVLVDKMHCHGLLRRGLVEDSLPETSSFALKPRSSAEICLAEARRGCRRLCERHDFTSATSHLPVPPSLYQHLVQQFSLSNGSDMAILTAFYPDLRYTEVKIWRKNLLHFFCTLGGYTGLLLGCSIVTFFEFFVYIGLIIAVVFKNLRASQQTVHPATKVFLKDTH
ncbi:uncharacterized protein LOC123512043 [Portunus trituberculatus]|uniref:uncharacterized protein LOC123512043 n=1 Tax=Portunus trituberculatus TaxID=210409 RepID=UPI001E1D0A2A|nr:uncharacterized protein LOC123512043 [Portunus trituberculatus]